MTGLQTELLIWRVLSHYLDSGYALRLIENHPARVGYLLKDRVMDGCPR